jgi:hypothetical protein
MSTSAKHASSMAAWPYLCRAMDAVNMATVQFSRTQLSPEARQESASQVAALMGKAELLLSVVREGDRSGPQRPRA